MESKIKAMVTCVSAALLLTFAPRDIRAQSVAVPLPANLPKNVHPDGLRTLSGPVLVELYARYGRPAVTLPPSDAQPSTICVERGPQNVTGSPYREVEPAGIGTNVGPTIYRATTYLRYLDPPADRYSMFYSQIQGTAVSSGEMPRHASYASYADPWLDANFSGGGVSPGRFYNVGLMHNGYNNGISAAAVWTSDNRGLTWSSPHIAASSSSSSLFIDFPRLAVSAASNSQGHLYVAYTRINVSTGFHEIFVTRSTDGGNSFSTPVLVTSSNSVGSQQVLVAPATGYVYVIWLDLASKSVKMSRSTNFGVGWSSPETAATATYGFLDSGTAIAGNVRANTIPMARFNFVSNRVMVTWHEWQDAGHTATDVYFASKGTTWSPKIRLNDNFTNDQFFPALDFDAQGISLVTFYDRRSDPLNHAYVIYGAKLDSQGNPIGANFALQNCGSDPTFYGPPSGGVNFIGDFQTTWSWPFPDGSQWVTFWIGHPNPGTSVYGDVIMLNSF